MELERWLRNKARAAVDGLFCSRSPSVQRMGDPDSGWVIDTGLPLDVCVCAGVGKGISFEVELARHAPRPVLVLDPSPTAVPTIARTDMRNLEFVPVGLAATDGVVEFSVPADPCEGSFSVAREGLERVAFECWSLQTILRRFGKHAVDLLKMDIEGFEFDIVEQILTERIPVRQICVEFHPWLRPGKTWKALWRLRTAGYRIVYKQRGDHTLVMDAASWDRLLRAHGR